MSNLKQLKEQFDKVYIKYDGTSCSVLLVDGLNVFKGTSQCHKEDNFNRKLGRTIALGRAELAYKVGSGDAEPRTGIKLLSTGFYSEYPKQAIIRCGTPEILEECINSFVQKKIQ